MQITLYMLHDKYVVTELPENVTFTQYKQLHEQNNNTYFRLLYLINTVVKILENVDLFIYLFVSSTTK